MLERCSWPYIFLFSNGALPPSLQETKQEDEERLILESNPLEWTVTDVVRFIKLTDCAPLAKIFQEQVQWLAVSKIYFLDSRSCLPVFACLSVLSINICVFMCVHLLVFVCVHVCACGCKAQRTTGSLPCLKRCHLLETGSLSDLELT